VAPFDAAAKDDHHERQGTGLLRFDPLGLSVFSFCNVKSPPVTRLIAIAAMSLGDALFGGPDDDGLLGYDGDDVLVGGLGTNTLRRRPRNQHAHRLLAASGRRSSPSPTPLS
jgi:hypothetical protein